MPPTNKNADRRSQRPGKSHADTNQLRQPERGHNEKIKPDTGRTLLRFIAPDGHLGSYPDLKANQNFLELQAQLEGTENRIAVERRKFNEWSGATTPTSGNSPKTSWQACSDLFPNLTLKPTAEQKMPPK